jgi:hypothetical protein
VGSIGSATLIVTTTPTAGLSGMLIQINALSDSRHFANRRMCVFAYR